MIRSFKVNNCQPIDVYHFLRQQTFVKCEGHAGVGPEYIESNEMVGTPAWT